MLNNLLNEVGKNENHPLTSLMESIGNLIETYENKNVSTMSGHPIEPLHYLMKEHNLTQTDLPEIGSQGVVSEILKEAFEYQASQRAKLKIQHIPSCLHPRQ